MSIPFAVSAPESEGLNFLGCEVSYGDGWVNINDGDRFKVAAQGTLDQSSKTWRKITAQSPVLGGTYLVHAVPEMISETISVFSYGNDQTDLNESMEILDLLFEQFSYKIRWTFNEYREYWTCEVAEASFSRGQVWTHSQMSLSTFTIPRFPSKVRERIG